jgi:hypothetical protein
VGKKVGDSDGELVGTTKEGDAEGEVVGGSDGELVLTKEEDAEGEVVSGSDGELVSTKEEDAEGEVVSGSDGELVSTKEEDAEGEVVGGLGGLSGKVIADIRASEDEESFLSSPVTAKGINTARVMHKIASTDANISLFRCLTSTVVPLTALSSWGVADAPLVILKLMVKFLLLLLPLYSKMTPSNCQMPYLVLQHK